MLEERDALLFVGVVCSIGLVWENIAGKLPTSGIWKLYTRERHLEQS